MSGEDSSEQESAMVPQRKQFYISLSYALKTSKHNSTFPPFFEIKFKFKLNLFVLEWCIHESICARVCVCRVHMYTCKWRPEVNACGLTNLSLETELFTESAAG